jgi:hypothetical protein
LIGRAEQKCCNAPQKFHIAPIAGVLLVLGFGLIQLR